MLAMLGMYDLSALHGANDRFWQAIRAQLGFGPDHLTRDRDVWSVWQSPDLLLSQTCGMPYRTSLHADVTLVGTPDYGLPDCPAGYYNSVLVARKDAPGNHVGDFSGGTFAYNEPLSQSGWAAPVTHLNNAGVTFPVRVQTGGHANSARVVAEGGADMAGLDALTWALLQTHNPALTDQLRVIDTTAPTPTLPYITAAGRDPAPIAAAIRGAIDNMESSDRAALHLKGLIPIPAAAYLAVPNPSGP